MSELAPKSLANGIFDRDVGIGDDVAAHLEVDVPGSSPCGGERIRDGLDREARLRPEFDHLQSLPPAALATLRKLPVDTCGSPSLARRVPRIHRSFMVEPVLSD